MLRRFHVAKPGAPFQTKLVSLEANTTPEELDDLGALTLADVHQTHRADAPTAPAFAEFPGTDEKVDWAIAAIEVRKQRL
jgi:hypothetical protein